VKSVGSCGVEVDEKLRILWRVIFFYDFFNASKFVDKWKYVDRHFRRIYFPGKVFALSGKIIFPILRVRNSTTC